MKEQDAKESMPERNTMKIIEMEMPNLLNEAGGQSDGDSQKDQGIKGSVHISSR